jgi:hypothetical protein
LKDAGTGIQVRNIKCQRYQNGKAFRPVFPVYQKRQGYCLSPPLQNLKDLLKVQPHEGTNKIYGFRVAGFLFGMTGMPNFA